MAPVSRLAYRLLPASRPRSPAWGEKVVGPERFELPAFWFVAVAARRINSLAAFAWSGIRLYLCGLLAHLLQRRQAPTNGQWAQFWAQSRGVTPSIETIRDWHTCH